MLPKHESANGFRMAVLAEKIPAYEAQQQGSFMQFIEQALEQAWQALAKKIQDHPASLVTAVVSLLDKADNQSLAQQLAHEQELQSKLGKQAYFRECMMRK